MTSPCSFVSCFDLTLSTRSCTSFFCFGNIESVGGVVGHDIEDMIPQLKVRILELLLKMQPKLKVCLVDLISGIAVAHK